MANERAPMQIPGVIAYFTVSDTKAATAFYEKAFGAKLIDRRETPDGRSMHVHVEINGGAMMFNDPFPEHGTADEPHEEHHAASRSSTTPTNGGSAPPMPAPKWCIRWKSPSGATNTARSRTRSASPGASSARPEPAFHSSTRNGRRPAPASFARWSRHFAAPSSPGQHRAGQAQALQRPRRRAVDQRDHRAGEFAACQPDILVDDVELRPEQVQQLRRLLRHDVDVALRPLARHPRCRRPGRRSRRRRR